MLEIFFPVKPWVGLLSAFGVVVMFVTYVALRSASAAVRTVAAMVGAVFVGYAIANGLGSIVSFGAYLALDDLDGEWGRRVLDIILVASGVAVGVAAVLRAHARADGAEAELALDERVLAELADDDPTGDDLSGDEPDPYTLSLRRRVAARPWIDFGALAVALALPVTILALLGRSFPAFGSERDVTALLAVHFVVNGLVLAAPLLVMVARDDAADPRPVAAAFGLLALHAVVLPLWPGFFANEFWAAFGAGTGAGLVTAAGFNLAKEAIPDHRPHVVSGALLAVALLTLSVVVYARGFIRGGF